MGKDIKEGFVTLNSFLTSCQKIDKIDYMSSLLKRVTVGGIDGYSMKNIQEYLGPKEYARFQSWIAGQTVGVLDAKPVVYAHDFERFLSGLLPID